jgi:hypothetical protein
MVSTWVLVLCLGLQAHFAASYLVPLDEQARAEIGGLLRWFWPWAYGDGGPLGRIAVGGDLPISGLFLALTAATLLVLAALAGAGFWVPFAWCRGLAAAGAALLVCLMTLFFGPTKLLPLAFALGTLYVALAKPALVGAG